MNTKLDADLKIIINEIQAILPGARIILFGSYASGREGRDSDLDLCVVADHFSGRRLDMMHAIRKAVAGKIKYSLDILLYRNSEFQEYAKSRPRLEYTIANEGVVVNA